MVLKNNFFNFNLFWLTNENFILVIIEYADSNAISFNCTRIAVEKTPR